MRLAFARASALAYPWDLACEMSALVRKQLDLWCSDAPQRLQDLDNRAFTGEANKRVLPLVPEFKLEDFEKFARKFRSKRGFGTPSESQGALNVGRSSRKGTLELLGKLA